MLRCFDYAQHDKSAITPPPQYPSHHNAGIIFNTRDTFVRFHNYTLSLTALRVLFLIPVMFRRGRMVGYVMVCAVGCGGAWCDMAWCDWVL